MRASALHIDECVDEWLPALSNTGFKDIRIQPQGIEDARFLDRMAQRLLLRKSAMGWHWQSLTYWPSCASIRTATSARRGSPMTSGIMQRSDGSNAPCMK